MRAAHTATPVHRASLADTYRRVRTLTVKLADPLSPEDMVVQVRPYASPTKWHLAHTTWFFETFVLAVHEPDFRPYDERFCVLFNSYYHAVGRQHPRQERGALTRPGIGEVMAYRDTIDARVASLVDRCDERELEVIARLVELGLHHEQQHQELLLADVKVLLHANPLRPCYREVGRTRASDPCGELSWTTFEGGVVEIGHHGVGFSYDNEQPRHRRFSEPFELADRPVTNGEFLVFVQDGGYRRPSLWLDDGWAWVAGRREAPRYWSCDDGSWSEFTLDGVRRLDLDAPVCHLNFFEADAYARWAGARLPTEVEWERAADRLEVSGNFLESERLHPVACLGDGLRQMFGDVWEWTRSAHEPYPGYTPPAGAIGEYNGKFMCGTFVLRGGSCVTSASHVRATYRNFFAPGATWQFSGVRLAREI